jgi:uncharacterized protein (DUF924 family)
MAGPEWYDEVLGFWFGELSAEAWFTRNDDVDRACRERFGHLHHQFAGTVPPAAFEQPRPALAAVVLFDQFPRNMYRGTPQAFASDRVAAQISRNALDKGFGGTMSVDEKQFLFMPLMHSEVLADQERCVMLFKTLGNDEALRYAEEHRDIIAKFGRFPHRNRALGRENSEAETEFLAQHAGFGQ